MRIGRTQDVIVAEPLVHPVPGPEAGPAPVDAGHVGTGHVDTGHVDTGHVDTAPVPAAARPTAARVVVRR